MAIGINDKEEVSLVPQRWAEGDVTNSAKIKLLRLTIERLYLRIHPCNLRSQVVR